MISQLLKPEPELMAMDEQPDPRDQLIRELVGACEKILSEFRNCAAIVGDTMYAQVKKDYRVKLRAMASDFDAALAKVKEVMG